jgi:aspartyl-tRNA(Asn)/glutamyl-tRNA(Gln) amidotransferase subunit C
MALTLLDVTRIAHLSRIQVTQAEAEAARARINDLFVLVEQLRAVDTTGIAPLAHPLDVIEPLAQRLRSDAVSECNQRERNQLSAPAVQDGLFLVPKVIE